jgi:hypothetical protein
MTTDTAIMAALGRQMTNAVARESVAAATRKHRHPGYRARETSFADALNLELAAT